MRELFFGRPLDFLRADSVPLLAREPRRSPARLADPIATNALGRAVSSGRVKSGGLAAKPWHTRTVRRWRKNLPTHAPRPDSVPPVLTTVRRLRHAVGRPATRPPGEAGCPAGFPGLAFIRSTRGGDWLDRRARARVGHAAECPFSPDTRWPMNDLSRKVVRFLLDDTGPTTVEYAMMLLLVLLTVLTVITALGQTTADGFHDSNHSVE